LVLADIDPEHAAEARPFHIAHERIDAAVVETETVDHSFVLGQSPHAWLRITRLRTRRRRADFDEAEAERCERVDVCPVLVEASGEADRIRKVDTDYVRWQRRRFDGEQWIEAGAIRSLHRDQAKIMRALGIKAEQEGSCQRVHVLRAS